MSKKFFVSLLILTTVFAFGCKPQEGTQINEQTEAEGTSQETPKETTNTQQTMKTAPESGDTIATLKTNQGDIKVLLYTEQAPETTKNFIELSKAGKYDGVNFHRVINDFMIQTGDFENRNGTGGHSYKGPGTLLQDEFGEGLKHLKGALSMANAGPNTGGSQFFIVQKEGGTDWLDGKHAIFGYTYEGMDVVDKIAGVETEPGDKPAEEVLIEKIEISTK